MVIISAYFDVFPWGTVIFRSANPARMGIKGHLGVIWGHWPFGESFWKKLKICHCTIHQGSHSCTSVHQRPLTFAIWTNKFSTWAASSSQTETCLAPIKLMCFIMFPIVILKILLEKRKSPMKFKISLGPLNSHWTPSICFLQYWRGPEKKKMVDPIYLWACSNSWYPHTLMYIQGLEHNTHRRITHVTSDLKIEIPICINYLSNECFHVFCFHRAVMIS